MAVTKFVLNETSYFGEGARSVLADEINNRGFKKVLVVTDKSLYEVGVSKKVTNILDEAGIEYGVYHDVLPNPPISNVNAGIQMCKDIGADVIVAIGGGSSIDTAKGISIIMTNPDRSDVVSLNGVSNTKNKGLPIIALPTTAGTAAEVTINYVITDPEREIKMVCVDEHDIPIVATIHATEAGRNSGIHDETQRYINDTEWLLTYEATEVIVNSNYMKNEIQRLFGLPFDKINVIPNGINLSNFTGIERDYDFRRQYAMDNEKIILYVGRLVYEKGVQHLIAAMPKILSNYHDAKLIIAGRGGMMDELRAEASNLGLNDKIYFTGYLNSKQVQKMYKCADVAVFPSTYEPFGIVALEAMLAGVPTVVSDVGGLDEIVTHGVDGMKSYAGNANSIADSVTALLYDHQLATNVSKKAKQKVKDQFNWEKIAQDTHFTYEKAICQTMAERQAKQMLQEKAKKTEKAENSQKEITNLLSFKKRHAYA